VTLLEKTDLISQKVSEKLLTESNNSRHLKLMENVENYKKNLKEGLVFS